VSDAARPTWVRRSRPQERFGEHFVQPISQRSAEGSVRYDSGGRGRRRAGSVWKGARATT
jgi:hypothetical protein